MSFREKIRLTVSGFAGIFVSKKRVEAEMKNLNENLDDYLKEIGKKFPTIKKTLIDDRNTYMANQIMKLSEQYHNIFVIIGDGHIPGISQLLQQRDSEVETIRLQQLRNYAPTLSENDVSTAHFSISHHHTDKE
jgi:pheromone shutdown protein TraB